MALCLSAIGCYATAQLGYTASAVAGHAWDTPGNLNPFIPGYFADPTIRKFGDTYYLYATTDGTGNGYGPAQVWVSKDFINWKNVILNWPTTEVVWAPDVVEQPDGSFRYYYCQPCQVSVGESVSPLGPWQNMLGSEDAVLVPDRFVHNVITLDPQLFRDDDGQEYLYFTTWGIYEGYGCGVARLNANYDGANKSYARGWSEQAPFRIAADDFFSEKRLIPNTALKDIFEAPFVFKRNGIYYFTYSSGSCHNDTYRVQYATSEVSPMGPFEYRGELLTSNADGTVDGPGHHSVLQDGDHYYIVYHRHDIAKATHGFNRQVCIDELHFNADGSIKPVTPTHDGLLPASLAKLKAEKKGKKQCRNMALGTKVTASSYYNERFKPEYATDDNNATLWKARHCNNYSGLSPLQDEWVMIDLGRVETFNQIWTQMEYATFFYQYRIEVSTDGKVFRPYAIHDSDVWEDGRLVATANTRAGSPMIDEGEAKARFIRISISDTQKNGHFPAIWNVKVFRATKHNNPKDLLPSTADMDYSAVEASYPNLHKKDVSEEERKEAIGRGFKVVDINADDYAQGKRVVTREIRNRHGGCFSGDEVVVEVKKGKYAFFFDGQSTMKSDFSLPATMRYNAPYTMAAWVLNPEVGSVETVAEFTERRNDLSTIELRHGTDPHHGLVAHNASFENFGAARECREGQGEWQHWVVSYDGYMEKIYLNGQLVNERNSFLMIRPEGRITLGASFDGANKFSGYIHSLTFMDRPMDAEEVQAEYDAPSATQDRTSLAAIDLRLDAEVLTPDYIRMVVTDSEGKAVRSGNLHCAFHVTEGKTEHSRVCQAVVTDDERSFSKTLTATVDVSPEQFSVLRHTETLRLSASTPDFIDHPTANGAVILETLKGDFVMQARVSDFDGRDTRQTPAYNEAGIIVVEPEHGFVHNGIFPAYNCGNMLTQVWHGRPQFAVQNGWDYDPWIQLQRAGNLLYARRSADGMTWTDMPGSPMHIVAEEVQLGVYQTTYTANKSWAEISDFVVFQKR